MDERLKTITFLIVVTVQEFFRLEILGQCFFDPYKLNRIFFNFLFL